MSLKNFDFKQFAITHGEKIVLGVIGLLVLVALGRTTWKTYDKKPSEVVKKATDASAFIEANQWPEEHRAKYTADNRLAGKIQEMLKPIPGGSWRARDGGGLALSIPPSYTLYVKEKLLEKPNILPVRSLIASSFPIVGAELVSNETEEGGSGVYGDDPMNDGGTGTFKGSKKKKTGFRTGRGSKTGGTTGGMGPGSDAGTGMGPTAGVGGAGASGKGSDKFVGPSDGGMGTGCPGSGADVGSGGAGAGEGAAFVNSKGLRVISVRGIFPIKQQLAEYEKALNLLKGYYANDPQQIVQIFGFTVERQVSSDRGKSWTAWEQVNMERNLKQLTSLNWEDDVVVPGVTHPEITAPLLERLFLPWGDEATHPEIDIERYKQTKEGRERMKKFREEMAKQKENQNAIKKAQKSSGYGQIRRDLNNQGRGLLGNEGDDDMGSGCPMPGSSGGSSNRFIQGLRDRFKDGEDFKKFKQEITAAGDLILFRYFDFDVVPGLSYRYRVKLKMKNPLFEKPAEKVKLDAQKSTSQEFVDTPYSNTTDVTTVPTDTHYFLARVHQVNSASMPEPHTTLKVYKWLPDLGTIVTGEVPKLKVGNFVAGTDEKTTRLDLGREELQINAETEFDTKTVVLDIMGGRKALDTSQTNDLGLPRNLNPFKLYDEVIVVDETGRLKSLDPYSNKATKKSIDDHIARRDAFYKKEKWTRDMKEEDAGDGTGDGSANEEFGGPMGMSDGDAGSGSGRGNRRGRRRKTSGQGRRGSSGSGGYYGPYGSGGGMGMGSSSSGRRSSGRRRSSRRGSAPDCGE